MKNVVYMKVTRDKYELPVAVADSATELARILDVNRKSIISAISREKVGKTKWSAYKRVEIDNN